MVGRAEIWEEKMPKNAIIYLIRHAEKPPAGTDLAPEGQARAAAYTAYFRNLTNGSNQVQLSHLVAAADSPDSYRPRLTIEPLASALGLPIDATCADKEYGTLVTEILQDSKYNDSNTLICWHHQQILKLAHALGAHESVLPPQSDWPTPPWPEEVYGWLLQLVYGADGQLVPDQTRCINQQLMYGDCSKDPTAASALVLQPGA
jgi:hypothetical protein